MLFFLGGGKAQTRRATNEIDHGLRGKQPARGLRSLVIHGEKRQFTGVAGFGESYLLVVIHNYSSYRSPKTTRRNFSAKHSNYRKRAA